MNDTVYIYKNLGETPLEALTRLRLERPELQNEKLSYAGRLDPMAEGVILVLIGEANKSREKYLNLSKEYEFEVLFGFATDTYDLLGLVVEAKSSEIFHLRGSHSVIREGRKREKFQRTELLSILQNFLGKQDQEYPPYSSKTVLGKPLFAWAKEGKIKDIEIPKREIEIFDIELLSMSEILGAELLKSIIEKISKVKGDFRQEEIISLWKTTLSKRADIKFPIAKIRMHASSGTYARSVANEIGKKLGLPSIAYSIKRTAYR